MSRDKLLKASRGQPCIRCGADDGTVVAAHYSGRMAHRLGKGLGIKPHNLAVADLCAECHAEMDGYRGGNDVERSEEFLLLCMMTAIRRVESGLIA